MRGTTNGCAGVTVGLGSTDGGCGGALTTCLFLARGEAAERRFAHEKRLEIGGPCVRFERFGCNDTETSESYSDRFKRRPGAGSRDMSLSPCLLLGLVGLLCWAFGQDAIGIWRGGDWAEWGGGGGWEGGLGGYSWSI